MAVWVVEDEVRVRASINPRGGRYEESNEREHLRAVLMAMGFAFLASTPIQARQDEPAEAMNEAPGAAKAQPGVTGKMRKSSQRLAPGSVLP